jgi:hypothetical protein
LGPLAAAGAAPGVPFATGAAAGLAAFPPDAGFGEAELSEFASAAGGELAVLVALLKLFFIPDISQSKP